MIRILRAITIPSQRRQFIWRDRAPKIVICLLVLGLCVTRLTAQGNCQIDNTFAVFFQSYSSATVQTTGSIQFRCSSNVTYTLGLSAGSTPGATITNRLLQRTSDGATLGYQLFSNASYTMNWGNSANTGWVTGNGQGNDVTLTVYAQIPGGEAYFANPNGTNFSDTVTVTLTWGSNQITRTLQITLQQVAPGCGIGATPLSFGNYSGSLLKSTATLQIACTGGDPYNVGLNAGTGVGTTTTTRKMTGLGGAVLNYQLFSNSGYTTNWGNTIGTDTVTGTGSNGVQNLTVYGQIPAGQTVATGSYTDTIVATLTY